MVVLHNLHWNFLFSHQMICKQYIVLNHVFFLYESNLKPITVLSVLSMFSHVPVEFRPHHPKG